MALGRTFIISLGAHAVFFSLAAVASFTARPDAAGRNVLFVDLSTDFVGHYEGSSRAPHSKVKESFQEETSPYAADAFPVSAQASVRASAPEKIVEAPASYESEAGAPGPDGVGIMGDPYAMAESVGSDTAGETKGGAPPDWAYVIAGAIERAKSYPQLARLRGMEGTVYASFFIDESGMPRDIAIVKSSGYGLLDAEARSTIKRASPYPAIGKRAEVPIVFRLTDKQD